MYYDKSKFTDSDVKSLDTMLAKDKVAFNITEGWYMSSFFLANDCVYFGKDGKDNAAGIDIQVIRVQMQRKQWYLWSTIQIL